MVVQPGAGTAPVTSVINAARHSIRLEVYLLDNRTIINALARARQRGVDVRVVLEEHPYGAGRYARLGFDELQAAHVPVQWANESAFTFTHTKSIEVDGLVAGIYTFNLSTSGLFDNREFGLIDWDSRAAHAIGAIVDADWNRRRPALSDPTLVVSPYSSRRALQGLIDGAHRTLDIYAEEVADSQIEAHLAAAVRRHVRVRLITSATSPGVDALRANGARVSIMAQPYVHAKAMVADGHRLFIGSENISTTSLDSNREIGILLNNSTLAGVIERTFGQDWAGSGAAPPPAPATPTTHGAFGVRVVATPPALRRGSLLTITASTRTGASCTVRVTYPDGYVSRSRALQRVEIADARGTVSWHWHMGSTVTGTASAVVTCTLGTRRASASATFQITR